jgi:hypothetical protein
MCHCAAAAVAAGLAGLTARYSFEAKIPYRRFALVLSQRFPCSVRQRSKVTAAQRLDPGASKPTANQRAKVIPIRSKGSSKRSGNRTCVSILAGAIWIARLDAKGGSSKCTAGFGTCCSSSVFGAESLSEPEAALMSPHRRCQTNCPCSTHQIRTTGAERSKRFRQARRGSGRTWHGDPGVGRTYPGEGRPAEQPNGVHWPSSLPFERR